MIPAPLVMKGICLCTEAPMGRKGLEGYVKGMRYKYQFIPQELDMSAYFRVYPDRHSAYYETCSKATFYNHFKPKTVRRNQCKSPQPST